MIRCADLDQSGRGERDHSAADGRLHLDIAIGLTFQTPEADLIHHARGHRPAAEGPQGAREAGDREAVRQRNLGRERLVRAIEATIGDFGGAKIAFGYIQDYLTRRSPFWRSSPRRSA